MALGARLELRQAQALVMTPQLLQAIKLLQLSSADLAAYVEAEVERNPLLERAEGEPALPGELPEVVEAPTAPVDGDWAQDQLATERGALEAELGTDLGNAFPDRDTGAADPRPQDDGPTLPTLGLGAVGGGGSFDGDEETALDRLGARALSLQDALERQCFAVLDTAGDRMIAAAIIEAIEPTGYLAEAPAAIATRLGVEEADVLAVLDVVQACEPTGVGARDLAECLALQLREKGRLDPAMRALLDHLPVLARRDFAALRRICQLGDEDLAEMLAEIRRLDPKPGLAFGHETPPPVIPDVIVRRAPDGGWQVELNGDALPRVIANRSYYLQVARGAKAGPDKGFLDEAWANANWLTRSLEQRARTILRVTAEIVRLQDGFLNHGVQHLRPLSLKTVADAVSLHESTVSRVTSNKFVATPRGIFELKYFFTTAIAGAEGGESHSAEAVRHRIRALIDAEPADAVLSDDAIVAVLRREGVEIARRTVAKYRESLRIPSSAMRRREKRVLGQRSRGAEDLTTLGTRA